MEHNGNVEQPSEDLVANAFRQGTPLDEAMKRTFRDAVIQHRHNGIPMVFWQDGKVTLVPADQVPID